MTGTVVLPPPIPPAWLKLLAVVAGLFGLLTIVSGGKVLFGPPEARLAAGNYVPFVLWFNFLAGFFYVGAAVAIWRGASVAFPMSALLAAATLAVFVLFILHVMSGAPHEVRTLGAMILRSGFWVGVTAALWWWKGRGQAES